MASNNNSVAIGIDLGTTYSCVGVFRNGHVDIIANSSGSNVTPSFVAFNKHERLVGEAAKAQANFNPRNTIFEAKRLIGRKFDDPAVKDSIQLCPFKVVNLGGGPKIQVEYRNELKVFTPEEISSMVLGELKKVAEEYLGCSVSNAVVTVPAYFNDSQRQATKDAGTIAGLNILAILNEPTAAALAYGIHKGVSSSKKILVFDLGGGTFDVAVLSINEGEFIVEAVGGDTHLGGGDFDKRLLKYFLMLIKQSHGKDLSQNFKALSRLKSVCEAAKRMLSSSLMAPVIVDNLFDENDFHQTISRVRFEQLCQGLFLKTLEHVKAVLVDADLQKEEIDEVLLVGGSTRIPKIRELLQGFFNGKQLNRTINPDEAVAYGAAIKAAMLSGGNSIDEVSLTDVIPHSIGMMSNGKDMITFLKRNTKIPVNVVQNHWTTEEDFQTDGDMAVYEGENDLVKNNNLLGHFQLSNIERARKGIPKITISFSVDSNGILKLSAMDTKTKSSKNVTITAYKGRLSMDQIRRKMAEAKQFEDDYADHNADPTESIQLLELYCLSLKLLVGSRSVRDNVTEDEREYVILLCNETIKWMEEHDGSTKKKYDQMLHNLKTNCWPIVLQLG